MVFPPEPFVVCRINYLVGGHACCNAFYYTYDGPDGTTTIAEGIAEDFWLQMAPAYRINTSNEVQYLSTSAEIHYSGVVSYGVLGLGPLIFGFLEGASLPGQDVAVLARHVGNVDVDGNVHPGRVLFGHVYLSGLAENQVDGGLLPDFYASSIGSIGYAGQTFRGGEILWSSSRNAWFPIRSYVVRTVVKVIRRRRRPSS